MPQLPERPGPVQASGCPSRSLACSCRLFSFQLNAPNARTSLSQPIPAQIEMSPRRVPIYETKDFPGAHKPYTRRKKEPGPHKRPGLCGALHLIAQAQGKLTANQVIEGAVAVAAARDQETW